MLLSKYTAECFLLTILYLLEIRKSLDIGHLTLSLIMDVLNTESHFYFLNIHGKSSLPNYLKSDNT